MYRNYFKRVFDIFFSLFVLIMIFPLLIILIFVIWLLDGQPVFFLQERVGKDGIKFRLIKFRTMRTDAASKGLLTVGSRDPRITKTGYYLRKFKLDELPQIFNVLKGDMSWVGPRPEVSKYVALYTPEQKKVLTVKPGITDRASIAYFEESDLLKQSENPEEIYIREIMPAKLKMNLEYIQRIRFTEDVSILWKTFLRIFKK